jgi:hypothetical protein
VAAFLEVHFCLRDIADVWEQGEHRGVIQTEQGAVLDFYGPDLDTSRVRTVVAPTQFGGGLESSISDVIFERQLNDLPLAGRDAYTLLAILAGVTSDATTSRGLGLSVNGQRPSASSFLLDGVENNNQVVTGPLTQVAPEALQEYRISLNNFSAEYGRTSGFLANAVTRPGGNHWHGLLYGNLKNEALNANGFQQNRAGVARGPLKELQPGISVAGPLRRDALFAAFSLERFRRRSFDEPVTVNLPTTAYKLYTAPDSLARKLLDQYRAPLPDAGVLPTAEVTISPPAALDRWLSVARVDRLAHQGAHRLMGRLLFSRVDRPGFVWTPYPDFVSGLRENTLSAALGVTNTLGPSLVHEGRFSVSDDDLHWDRPHPEIPTLTAESGTLLPGSPAFYAYRNRNRNY